MRKGLLLFSLVLFGITASAEAAVRWHLEFKPLKMDRIVVRSGNEAIPYYYLIYTVKNPTTSPIFLDLSIKAVSDVSGLTYFEWFSPMAVAAVQDREGIPLLNVRQMRRKIGPGESLKAVALFRKVHEGTNLLKVEIAGLWDTVYREKGELVFEEKVLDVYFSRPGDPYYPQFDHFFFKKEEWVVLKRQNKAFR